MKEEEVYRGGAENEEEVVKSAEAREIFWRPQCVISTCITDFYYTAICIRVVCKKDRSIGSRAIFGGVHQCGYDVSSVYLRSSGLNASIFYIYVRAIRFSNGSWPSFIGFR